MAVSILSSECRPCRTFPALSSFSMAGKRTASIRFCSSAGTDWRSENSASRYSSDLSVPAGPPPAVDMAAS